MDNMNNTGLGNPKEVVYELVLFYKETLGNAIEKCDCAGQRICECCYVQDKKIIIEITYSDRFPDDESSYEYQHCIKQCEEISVKIQKYLEEYLKKNGGEILKVRRAPIIYEFDVKIAGLKIVLGADFAADSGGARITLDEIDKCVEKYKICAGRDSPSPLGLGRRPRDL